MSITAQRIPYQAKNFSNMITAHAQKTFIENVKRFLNHKIILGQKSHYFQCSFKKQPLDRVKMIFGKMLTINTNFPVGQWALYVKRHEDLLQAILPVPGNPAYESSLNTLTELVREANNIIDALNLHDLV